jgi:hypothetical protein
MGIKRGFLLDRGKFTRIDVPGALSTEAVGINDRRQVVGQYESPSAPAGGPSLQRAADIQPFGGLAGPLQPNSG